MKGINLLPWREELREVQKKEFIFSLALSAVGAVILVFFIHLLISNAISNQKDANNYLQQQILTLDVQLKQIADLKAQKQLLIARMKLIQQLEASRPQVVNLFKLLVTSMPNGVYLESVKREGDDVLLEGKAQSNTLVSALMRDIGKYPWVNDIILDEIKSDDSDLDYNKVFKLQFTLINPLDVGQPKS